MKKPGIDKIKENEMADLFHKAQWIWEDKTRKNSYLGASRLFHVPIAECRVSLSIFVDTMYKLYVNGRFVNAGPAPFKKPVIMVDSYDITPYIHQGENTAFILAHFIGVDVKFNLADKPGITALINIKPAGKEPIHIPTDQNWRVYPLSVWNENTLKMNWALDFVEDIRMGDFSLKVLSYYASQDYGQGAPPSKTEVEKLGREPKITRYPGLDIRPRMVPLLTWKKERVSQIKEIYRTTPEIHNLRDNSLRLLAEHTKPIYDVEKYHLFKPERIKLGRKRGELGYSLVYDLGRIVAADISFHIISSSAGVLDIGFSEILKDGCPDLFRLGSHYYARIHMEKGVNRFRIFSYSGFRYLYIVLKDFEGKLTINEISVHNRQADLRYIDKLEVEDRPLANIYDISRRSVILNTQANTLDCNSREKGTYWGDSLWIADMVGHMTGDFSHMRRLCYGATDELPKNGFLPSNLYGLGEVLFDYCLIPVIVMKNYFTYTKDKKTILDNLKTAERIIQTFRSLKDESGLVCLKDYIGEVKDEKGITCRILFLDHPGTSWHCTNTTPIDRDDYNAGINLFYLWALEALEYLYENLSLEKSVTKELEDLKSLIRDKFYMEEVGLIADAVNETKVQYSYSQIVNALAVITGVIWGKEASFALKTITDTDRNTWISKGTPYTYFYIFEALIKSGLAAMGIEITRKEWMIMLERGATTTWEGFRGEHHDSYNHAWSAPLPYLLYKGIAGVSPIEPGYGKVKISPCLKSMPRFAYSFSLPQGKISLSWERIIKEKQYKVHIQLPHSVKGYFTWEDTEIPFEKELETTVRDKG